MKRLADLLDEALHRVPELMPWDLQDRLAGADAPVVLDVREPAEFLQAHIAGSLNVPRGVLEQACEWDHDVTEPLLAGGRAAALVVVCRSGHRSLLAADTLLTMGFTRVWSLRTGVRGWNDADLPLCTEHGQGQGHGRVIDADAAEEALAAIVRPEQRRPR